MLKVSLLLPLLLLVGFASLKVRASADDEACWSQLESQLANELNHKVPAEVKKLAEDVRSLNPNLDELNLYELATDKRAELDVKRAGFLRDEQQVQRLVEACVAHITDATFILEDSECGAWAMKAEKGARAALREHPMVAETMGTVQLCLMQ